MLIFGGIKTKVRGERGGETDNTRQELPFAI